jgi:hypothetical protein
VKQLSFGEPASPLRLWWLAALDALVLGLMVVTHAPVFAVVLLASATAAALIACIVLAVVRRLNRNAR